MPGAQHGRAGGEEAADDVVPQAGAANRAGGEGGLLGPELQDGAQQRQGREGGEIEG
jgi:hypothetical protein